MGYIFDAISKSDEGDGATGKRKQPNAAPPTPNRAADTVEPACAESDAPTELAAPAESANLSLTSADGPLAGGPMRIDRAAPTPARPRAIAASAQLAPPPPLKLTVSDDKQTKKAVAKLDDRLVALQKPASIMAEEYRSIRTGLLAKWEQRTHLVHTITSATPQEGKTITSLNLGLSFAELRNRRTVVVEADLRLPQFVNLLGLAESPGVIGLLDEKCTLDDAVHQIPGSRLHVIPAGKRVSNDAVQILSSTQMELLLASLRKRYDHVIIDTPPVVELADAGILGAMSDDVLMIVRMNRTPRSLVEQAIRTLNSYNAPVAGLIATDQNRHMRRYYYKYGYRYRYSRGYYAEAA